VIEGNTVVAEERLLSDLGFRVRLVEQGPDGTIYVGVDDGLLLRLSPLATSTKPANNEKHQ
jgi:glucose/arabinose dehydrogenase